MKKEGEDFMEHLLVDSQLVITIQLVQKKDGLLSRSRLLGKIELNLNSRACSTS